MRVIMTLRMLLGGILIGMMVNDGHYDLAVMLDPASAEAAKAAVGHYVVVAGGKSLIFEYFVPLMIATLVILQIVLLTRIRNTLTIVQTVMVVSSIAVFGILVSPALEMIATGTSTGAPLLSALLKTAYGHLCLIIVLVAYIVIDHHLQPIFQVDAKAR